MKNSKNILLIALLGAIVLQINPVQSMDDTPKGNIDNSGYKFKGTPKEGNDFSNKTVIYHHNNMQFDLQTQKVNNGNDTTLFGADEKEINHISNNNGPGSEQVNNSFSYNKANNSKANTNVLNMEYFKSNRRQLSEQNEKNKYEYIEKFIWYLLDINTKPVFSTNLLNDLPNFTFQDIKILYDILQNKDIQSFLQNNFREIVRYIDYSELFNQLSNVKYKDQKCRDLLSDIVIFTAFDNKSFSQFYHSIFKNTDEFKQKNSLTEFLSLCSSKFLKQYLEYDSGHTNSNFTFVTIINALKEKIKEYSLCVDLNIIKNIKIQVTNYIKQQRKKYPNLMKDNKLYDQNGKLEVLELLDKSLSIWYDEMKSLSGMDKNNKNNNTINYNKINQYVNTGNEHVKQDDAVLTNLTFDTINTGLHYINEKIGSEMKLEDDYNVQKYKNNSSFPDRKYKSSISNNNYKQNNTYSNIINNNDKDNYINFNALADCVLDYNSTNDKKYVDIFIDTIQNIRRTIKNSKQDDKTKSLQLKTLDNNLSLIFSNLINNSDGILNKNLQYVTEKLFGYY